jgi:hypothetical protein
MARKRPTKREMHAEGTAEIDADLRELMAIKDELSKLDMRVQKMMRRKLKSLEKSREIGAQIEPQNDASSPEV